MDVKNQILGLARNLIDNEDSFVVCVEEKGINSYVVYTDGSKGIKVHDCSLWNRGLRVEIEKHIKSLADGNFDLEVSSFGLGRALVDERQYITNKGRKAIVHYEGEDHEESSAEGVLKEIGDNEILVELTSIKNPKNIQVQELKINRNKIKKIKIEVTF